MTVLVNIVIYCWQGQKLLANGEITTESEEKSGSDTDSQSTPHQSPAHKQGKITHELLILKNISNQ